MLSARSSAGTGRRNDKGFQRPLVAREDMARIKRHFCVLSGRSAQVASITAIDASAPPPAPGPSSRSPVALVVGPAVLISSVNLLVGGATLPDPVSLSMGIPNVAVNRVAAAPVVPVRDAAPGTGHPRFLYTAISSTASDHGVGPAMTHERVAKEPTARFAASANGQRHTNRAPADPATELARGTRAESAHLATIETRRDDPRALLLRTAAWSRERGRSNA
jgi:hypothetical protein